MRTFFSKWTPLCIGIVFGLLMTRLMFKLFVE